MTIKISRWTVKTTWYALVVGQTLAHTLFPWTMAIPRGRKLILNEHWYQLVSTAHAQWEEHRRLQLTIKNGKVVGESYWCWRQLIVYFLWRLVENSYSWTEINISYKIFDLVQYPRHLALWSQIIDGKYYGVELPVNVREGASGWMKMA